MREGQELHFPRAHCSGQVDGSRVSMAGLEQMVVAQIPLTDRGRF